MLTRSRNFVIIPAFERRKDLGTKRHAKKRHRQSLERRERNRAVRSATRTAVKKAAEATQAGAPEEAAEAQRSAQSALDVAARKGVIHKRTAARKKSRLARLARKETPKKK